MPDTAEAFLARRAAWVAAGRPADHPYMDEARATVAHLEAAGLTGPAIGVRAGDRFVTVQPRCGRYTGHQTTAHGPAVCTRPFAHDGRCG